MEKRKTNKSSDGVTSKPIWKKWWFWAIVVIVLISGTNTISNNSVHETETQKQVADESTEKQTAEETQEQETPIETETPVETQTEKEDEGHIYDNAIVKPVVNGSRTEKIGEYSVIETDSSLITDESLVDWYFNYVLNNDFNWCMILYTDKNNKEGVYSIEGFVEKGVVFDKDEFGDYSLGDSSHATILAPTDEGTLKEIK